MRRASFIIAFLGIFILLLILNLQSPIQVKSPSYLSKLTENTKVQTNGLVISERNYYDNVRILNLDNKLEILCNNCPYYVNKNLSILGTTQIYQNKTQIDALRIKIIQ